MLVDSPGTKGANFCFIYVFPAFSITEMERKATNHHVFMRMVGEVEMSRDWFGSVFIVNLNISRKRPPNLLPVLLRYIFLHKVQVIQ